MSLPSQWSPDTLHGHLLYESTASARGLLGGASLTTLGMNKPLATEGFQSGDRGSLLRS